MSDTTATILDKNPEGNVAENVKVKRASGGSGGIESGLSSEHSRHASSHSSEAQLTLSMDKLAVTMAQGYTGVDLLRNPFLNKGTAFTEAERTALSLHGHLPPKVETIEEQAARAYAIVSSKPNALEKFNALMDIQDTNETLFFRVIQDHLAEFAPIVYTPTIGEVCQKFSTIYRRPRGMYLTESHAGKIAQILKSEKRDVKLIVVTDNERILGLGDLGAGGLGIPIGKLNLYVAGGCIKPDQVLPISIDVGTLTDRQYIRDSEHYLGVKEERLRYRGAEGSDELAANKKKYHDFVEEFMIAAYERWPNVLVQFEDFWKTNAQDILDRYRNRFLSFNDDIQGTASVGVAGVFAAYRYLKQLDEKVNIADARLVMLGGGAAGIGITGLFEIAMKRLGCKDPKSQIAVLDSQGLITHSRKFTNRRGKEEVGFGGDPFKAQYAWSAEQVNSLLPGRADTTVALAELIDNFKPTVLIGTSGTPNTFTEEAIRNMAKHCDRPIIMPMSNPTSKCEAKPVDIVKWTDERAIIATGSPFAPVTLANGTQQRIGQGNNVFIFPGLGLGAILAKTKTVTDNMLYRSAQALADEVTQEDLDAGSCYPSIKKLVSVTEKVAVGVIEQAIEDGMSEINEEDLLAYVKKNMWKPEYSSYI